MKGKGVEKIPSSSKDSASPDALKIWICEGEKDVLSLEAKDSCNDDPEVLESVAGIAKYFKEFPHRDRPDNDPEGISTRRRSDIAHGPRRHH